MQIPSTARNKASFPQIQAKSGINLKTSFLNTALQCLEIQTGHLLEISIWIESQAVRQSS